MSSRVDEDLREELQEIAGWVEFNSVTRGVMTLAQAEHIDWVDLVVRAVSRDYV